MIKNPKNTSQLIIKNNATGKLLITPDQKFSIIIFTQRQELLGKGAFGKCYIGILQSNESSASTDRHQNPKNQKHKKHPIVVVKEIKKDKTKPKQQDMYKRQIQNLSLATKIPSTSKNLVKCYPYVLSSQKNYYMVMEYCDGKSLDKLLNQRIKQGKWLNFEEYLKIFADIVSGYYPLNKLNIMHEDLKPQNIFIKGKQFKIGDFGLSFLMNGQKPFCRGGSLSYNGKQKYQSPAGTPSHKSDMYAIGIILFRLFYGIHPYFEKNEWEMYRYSEAKRLMQLGNLRNSQFKISRWDELEMFSRFYETRKIKQLSPHVKLPQQTQQMRVYENRLMSLYNKKIPQLINKLIQKQIDDRSSFTELDMFVKENKINQILKYIHDIKSFEGTQKLDFFEDLNEQGQSTIKLGKSFNSLIDEICMQPGSEIQRRDLQMDTDMLRTAGNNRQRKALLMRKYPQVFGLKQKIEEINSVSRLLMNVYEKLNDLDLKQFYTTMRENNKLHDNNQSSQKLINRKGDHNELMYYEDKKLQVQFIVERYLYSFLVTIQKQIQEIIRKFNEQELRVYYRENVDFLLQLIKKNIDYLETQLFIAHQDQLNFDQCKRQLENAIKKEFLGECIVDSDNLVLTYYCVCILKINGFIEEIKQKLLQNKRTNQNNQFQDKDEQISSKSELQIFLNQWNTFSTLIKNLNTMQKVQEKHQHLKQLQSFVIKQLQKHNIPYMISIDD